MAVASDRAHAEAKRAALILALFLLLWNAKSPLVFGGAAINASMARESQAHLRGHSTKLLQSAE